MEEVRGVVGVVRMGGGSFLASFSSTCVSVLQCVETLADSLTFPEANWFGPLAHYCLSQVANQVANEVANVSLLHQVANVSLLHQVANVSLLHTGSST